MEPGQSPFMAAANGRPAPHTPVWFMRQAGRHLPEYRAIRGEGSILQAIKQPPLAAEITLQPFRRYGVDAAVLYSDIVVPAHAVGFGIDVAPGTGPVAAHPVRGRADLNRLPPLSAEQIPYVVDTCRLVRAELPDSVPLLAFAGAPFTVASYLIEGRPSREYVRTKALMTTDSTLWHDLLDRLADHSIAFIAAQLAAGASAFQLFDSWAGTLSRQQYERFVAPHSARVFRALAERFPDAPGIHFGIGCGHLLEAMAACGPRVIGLDWRVPIDEARQRLGEDTIIQGNLDPALVLCGWDAARTATDDVLTANGDHPGHIFNLGHGVLPATDPGVLRLLVDYVHERTGRR
jgi:uroporphyrinogen decarboxylase